IADNVMVLYLGAVMESAPTEQLYGAPSHPYTQALLSATLSADPTIRRQRMSLSGETPSPIDLPQGCLFSGRCPLALDSCRAGRPPLAHVPANALAAMREEAHLAACLRSETARERAPAH